MSHRVTLEGSFATVAAEAATSEPVIRTNYYQRTDAKTTKAFYGLGPREFRALIRQAPAGRPAGAAPATFRLPPAQT